MLALVALARCLVLGSIGQVIETFVSISREVIQTTHMEVPHASTRIPRKVTHAGLDFNRTYSGNRQ